MLSEFDCSCGSTSPTVRSTSTPLIMRKHLRELGRGVRVSRTSLGGVVSMLDPTEFRYGLVLAESSCAKVRARQMYGCGGGLVCSLIFGELYQN